MGEYQEDDVDDLLSGDDSDEDGDKDTGNQVNLLSMEEMSFNLPESSSESNLLNQIIFENDNVDDLEEDEEEEDKHDMDVDQDEGSVPGLNEGNKKKLENAFLQSSVPPGINLFRSKKINENIFQYFSMDTLNLETDFGYSRRPKLLDHGFSVETVEEIFSDRFEFVRHLFPLAHSVLICNQADFKSVMNFLFYSISVCSDRILSEMMKKAFFDLRKNYGFRWNLTLGHVLTCLLNFGADEAAVFSSRFYQKHLEKHREAVEKSGQKVHRKYQLPSLPDFVKRRRAEAGTEKEEGKLVHREHFRFCLVNFIQLLSDFSAGQPSHLEFRIKEDWSDQIIFIYILLIVGTDKRLINDWSVREAIRKAVHYHLETFSSHQWYWGPDREDKPRTVDGARDFNHSNVCKSLIILLNEFFPRELCPETVNWEVKEDHSEKVSFRKNNISDHHLNLLSRIDLIPPSHRGNQIKKYLAFMCIQTIAETVYVTPTHVDVLDIINIPELSSSLSPGLKLIVKAQNHDVLKTVVQLYDLVVGHEPLTDFTQDKVEAIQQINKHVLLWIEKKLPNNNGINIDDPKIKKRLELTDFLMIIKMRWQYYCPKK